MFDPDQVPLSTSEGRRPSSTAGDRMMVGLAALALMGGLLIAVSRLIPEQANQTSQATATPVQSAEAGESQPAAHAEPAIPPHRDRRSSADSQRRPAQRVCQRVGPAADRGDVAGKPVVRPRTPVGRLHQGDAGIRLRHAAGTRGSRGLASGRGPGQRLDLRRHQQRGHVRALPTPLAVQQRRLWPRVRRQRLPAFGWTANRVGGSDARFVRRHALAYLRAPSAAWGRTAANGPAGWLMAGNVDGPRSHQNNAVAVGGRRVMGSARRLASRR